jgi:hypothetical protein
MPIVSAPTARTAARTTRFGALATSVAFGTAALGTAVCVSLSSEAVVATAFQRALAALDQSSTLPVRRTLDGVSGSEEFWLSATADQRVVRAMSVGQHIMLDAGGAKRQLTITDVRDQGEAATHIDTAGGVRVIWLTCREGEGAATREIRLRIEAGRIVELPAPNAVSAAPQVL